MKFDFILFERGRIAVNCLTEDEAMAFLSYLFYNVREWAGERRLTALNGWALFGSDTCYTLRREKQGTRVLLSFVNDLNSGAYQVVPYRELKFEEEGEEFEESVPLHLLEFEEVKSDEV